MEKGGIGFAFEAGDAFVIAVVVRIDIDEAIERIASGFDLAGFEVEVEEADEGVEIFRFAIQFLVEVGDDFGDWQRGGIHGGHLVHVGDEFGFAAVAAHQIFCLDEERGGFGFVAAQDVSAGQFEELRESFRLLLVVGFENFAGAVEAVGAKERFAEEGEEGGVFFVGGDGIEELNAAFGVAFAEARFGEEQSAGAIVGRKLVGAVEIFDGFIESTGCLGELTGAKITARGEIAMAEAFG